MNKSFLFTLTISILSNIYADDLATKKTAMPQLESAFAPNPLAINTRTIATPVNWSTSNIGLTLNVQGQMTIIAKAQINISKIAVSIDDITVSDNVNLKLRPKLTIKYLVRTNDFIQHLDILKGNYKVLGITQELSADDYPGYNEYAYKVVKITLNYTDKNNNFNETTTDFLMVVGK